MLPHCSDQCNIRAAFENTRNAHTFVFEGVLTCKERKSATYSLVKAS